VKTANITSPQRYLSEFVQYNDKLALGILLVDLVIYTGAVTGAVISDSYLVKTLWASLAGFMIAQLFVIGHDAAHKAYVSSPALNIFIARLTFFTTLHNYTLWLFAHNQLHHAYPNVKNYNSWSPMSAEEYRDLSMPRKWLEKLYRSPLGFGPYYLIERWLKDKFIPRRHIPHRFHRKAWSDFLKLMVYAVAFVSILVLLANATNQSVTAAIVFGAIVPYIVWNYAMGLTVYQQHTHPSVKWYRSMQDWKQDIQSQSEISIHLSYPDWYNLITHNCYYHPVHHVNPKIPIYQLKKAQRNYSKTYPGISIVVPFTLSGFMQTINKCKLYDYDQHQWLDFNGNPTTIALKTQETKQQQIAS